MKKSNSFIVKTILTLMVTLNMANANSSEVLAAEQEVRTYYDMPRYGFNCYNPVETYVINGVGDVDVSWLQKAEIEYVKIPENIRTRFQLDSRTTIHVVENNLDSYSSDNATYDGTPVANPSGMCCFAIDENNEVTIFNVLISSDNRGPRSVPHEIGHYVDYANGVMYYSSSEEFINIYNAEVEAFRACKTFKTTYHNTSTAGEYFAESFKRYVYNPTLLKQVCPATYDFLDNVVTNF